MTMKTPTQIAAAVWLKVMRCDKEGGVAAIQAAIEEAITEDRRRCAEFGVRSAANASEDEPFPFDPPYRLDKP